MTMRWIATSLAVLALAGCNKKDADKPPPPKAEIPTTPTTSTTTTTTTTPTVAPPAVEETPVVPPPAVTTADAPPTITSTYRPAPRPPGQRPIVKVVKPKPAAKVVKTKAQLAAERQIVGTWTDQKTRKGKIVFTADGKVTSSNDPKFIWRGDWEAKPNGAVDFDLALPGAESGIQITAYPTPAKIMAIVPHWGKDLPGSGQYAYERTK
jgi:hypothetical protein